MIFILSWYDHLNLIELFHIVQWRDTNMNFVEACWFLSFTTTTTYDSAQAVLGHTFVMTIDFEYFDFCYEKLKRYYFLCVQSLWVVSF